MIRCTLDFLPVARAELILKTNDFEEAIKWIDEHIPCDNYDMEMINE